MPPTVQTDPPGRIPSLPTEGFVRLPQILEVFPVSRSTWWDGVKTGRFPKPVKLGPATTAWSVAAIRELLASFRPSAAE
jgi:prophage regulatory protein